MAQSIAVADGNWSTAATWNPVRNTPTIHASTNIIISTGTLSSLTFTAPNITNYSTGCAVYLQAKGTAGNIVATLQENSIDTSATATITYANLTIAGIWLYFKWGTPYQYTATTAGYYRIKITMSGASGTTTIAADGAGSNFAYLATDDITAVPASTDDVFILGTNAATAITVTVDSSQTIGSGTITTLIAGGVQRGIGIGVITDSLGKIQWDTAASATLTCKGHFFVGKTGYMNMGTVLSPYPTGKIATLTFDENGTSGNYGLAFLSGSVVVLQGEPVISTSLWKTTYASGVGTAADPLIVADSVAWRVNDQIEVAATSDNVANYNETEVKYIKTVNSATSYVLCDTPGGAEAALTYTHTTSARIANIMRNVVINTDNSAEMFYAYNYNSTVGNVDIDWIRTENCGLTTVSKYGFYCASAVGNVIELDYSVSYNSGMYGFYWGASKELLTHTGLIVCNTVTAGAGIAFVILSVANNKNFIDCFAINNDRAGFYTANSANINFTRCIAISNDKYGASAGGWNIGGQNQTYIDCESHCNRGYGVIIVGVQATMNNFLCGTKGNHKTADMACTSDYFNQLTYVNSNFGSTTTITANYINQVPGSYVAFQNFNDLDNDCRVYTPMGTMKSTGATLADTNVRTAGSFAWRIAPENATDGQVWEFKVLAKADTAVNVYGFIQKNAAFGTDDCTVELYLPGSTTADDSYDMPDDTNWNVFTVSASYTGDVDRYATVKVICKTTTASAYVYVDDIFNGTNSITALDLFDNGFPSEVMYEQLGDAAAVWGTAVSGNTTAGTFGENAQITRVLADDASIIPK